MTKKKATERKDKFETKKGGFILKDKSGKIIKPKKKRTD